MRSTNQARIYVLMVLTISFGAILKIVGLEGILTGSHGVSVEILGAALLLGTLVSGLLLTGIFDGRNGFKRIIREILVWKAPVIWWLISIFAVPIAIGCSVLILSPFLSNPLPAMYKTENMLTMILSAAGAGIFVSIGEEIGWTGFLLNKVRATKSIVRTGVFIGFIWGLWHMVLFIVPDSFSSSIGILTLVMKLFTTLPVVRIIMIFVYENTKSFLITTTVHVSFVMSMMLFEPAFTNSEMLIYILTRTTILSGFLYLIMKKVAKQG